MAMTEPGRHEAPDEPPMVKSFRAELHDAISVRTFLLVAGVLALQLGFILSYIGAFHAPKPRNITVVVSAPQSDANAVVDRLNGLPASPLKTRIVGDAATAKQAVIDGRASAAFILNPSATTDTLLVASGGGTSVVTAVQDVLNRIEAGQRRTLTVQDVVPLQSGDGRGLSGFYLVTGWTVGGYLVASLLGVAKGARPATGRRAGIRLLSVVPYSIVSGFGGALVVDQVLGALSGHFLALWWLGALLVFAAAAVTMGLQVLFGVLGIGVTVLVFVVLGNPSAGGAYQPALLPPFWRALSGALPNGAGTESVRRIVYFGGHGIGTHLIVIAAYALAGTVVAIVASTMRERRG